MLDEVGDDGGVLRPWRLDLGVVVPPIDDAAVGQRGAAEDGPAVGRVERAERVAAAAHLLHLPVCGGRGDAAPRGVPLRHRDAARADHLGEEVVRVARDTPQQRVGAIDRCEAELWAVAVSPLLRDMGRYGEIWGDWGGRGQEPSAHSCEAQDRWERGEDVALCCSAHSCEVYDVPHCVPWRPVALCGTQEHMDMDGTWTGMM